MRILFAGLLFVSASFANAIDWTASIERVSSYPNGKVAVMLKDESSPNPAGSVFNCSSGWVTLTEGYSQATNSLVSLALTVYATKGKVRIGVNGSGSDCSVIYMTSL